MPGRVGILPGHGRSRLPAGWRVGGFDRPAVAGVVSIAYAAGQVQLVQVCERVVVEFDAETGGTFADERARRKAFATRVFGPDATPETRAMAGSLFYAYDGKISHLEAKLVRKLIFGNG